MKIQYNTYVIDFDRINELTAHPNDNPNNTSNLNVTLIYSHTRKLIKEYLDIYTQYNISSSNRSRTITNEEYLKVCEVLHYNRILISQSDIRDKKLNTVLSDDDDSKYYVDYDEDGFDDTLNPNAQ